MSPRTRRLIFAAVWGLAIVFALGLSYSYGISFWWAFALVAVAFIINGFVAEVEDRAPGGFLNPNAKGKSEK
jgi:hypothetical protein